VSIPFDSKLAKLRILLNREKSIFDTALAAYQRQKPKYDEAQLAFNERCKELGYCPVCEKKLADCKCVAFA